MNTHKKLSVTVGITTCYGGDSLLHTAKTILASEGNDTIRLIIQADRTPISASLKSELNKLGVELYWNNEQGSQIKKLTQIIKRVKSNIFIFTQDDITFNKNTISEIVKEFNRNPSLTMVGTRILPLKPELLFEAAMTSMLRIIDYIAGFWNKGDNYLSASGRCLSFRTSHLKNFIIPENIINGDMYLYLENKRLGGTFKRSKNSIVNIRCPQNIKDQVGPSSRFQYSQHEMEHFYDINLAREYKIPFISIAKALIIECLNNPVTFFYYVYIFIYSRFHRQSTNIVSNPIWDVDLSTKIL